MEEQKYISTIDLDKDVIIPLRNPEGLVRWMVQSFTQKAYYYHNACTVEHPGSPDAQTIANLFKESKFYDKVFVVNTPTFEYQDNSLCVVTMNYTSVLDLISNFNDMLKDGYLLFLYYNKINDNGLSYIRFAKFKSTKN